MAQEFENVSSTWSPKDRMKNDIGKNLNLTAIDLSIEERP